MGIAFSDGELYAARADGKVFVLKEPSLTWVAFPPVPGTPAAAVAEWEAQKERVRPGNSAAGPERRRP